LVVGLYNLYSRKLIHHSRVWLHKWTGIRSHWLDPHFAKIKGEGKATAWYRDQYLHPHETCHTIDEVMGWMEEGGIDFINSIPKPTGGLVLSSKEEMFQPKEKGTPWTRLKSQLANCGDGYREGGFFIMIGRRRKE